MTRSVAIVGCGTAGPAAATFLADDGWDVTLFEQAEELSPVGAGLLLQPAGQRVLHRLGVAEHVSTCAAHVGRLHGHSTSGRLVLDLRYRDLHRSLVGLGVHRAMLIEALLARLAQTTATLRCGVEVRSMRRSDERWILDTSTGPEGPFDLVVLADGARSHLRDDAGLLRRADEYPWGALWAIVPDHEGVYPNVLRQYYGSTTSFLGFLPSGRLEPGADPLVSVFWSVRNDRVDALRQTPFEDFRARLDAMAPEASSILDHLRGWDDFIHARYMDVRLKRPFGDGVVCIGDTAHAMSPQLGQGVTMALRDAEALADALRDARDVQSGLRRYWLRRRSATRFYEWGNMVSTWFFQHDFEPFAWVRDAVFGPLCFTPLAKGQLLRTLAGYKTGLLSAESVRASLPSSP